MKRPAVILAAAAGLLAIGLAAGGVLTRSPSRDQGRASIAPRSRRAPEPIRVPICRPAKTGLSRGARATAIAFATASQDWLYLNDEQIDRAVRAIATASAGPSLSAETVAELRTARDGLAKSTGRVWWLVRPLASRVERFDPATARVVVWTVTILSAADVALPQADWMRVTVDLAWEGDAWRLQAIDDVPGPTPMTGTKDRPWQPEPFDDALGGFERVSGEGTR